MGAGKRLSHCRLDPSLALGETEARRVARSTTPRPPAKARAVRPGSAPPGPGRPLPWPAARAPPGIRGATR